MIWDISFLEVDFKYSEQLQKLQNDLPFLPEKINMKKGKDLCVACLIKKNELYEEEL